MWAWQVVTLLLLGAVISACGDDRSSSVTTSSDEPTEQTRPATRDECVAASRGGLASPGATGLGVQANERLRSHRAEIILRLCLEDRWPAAAAGCYAQAEGLRELGTCWLRPPASTHLTEALQRQMHDDLKLRP